MASVNDPLVALEEHWAVSTFGAEQRAALVAFAEDSLRALRSGTTTTRARPAVEDLLALASAFDIAARERLDLDGLGSPFALAKPNDVTERRGYLRAGANRAFSLLAVAPVDFDDEVGALYRALLVVALAHVAGQAEPLRPWLAAYRRGLFPGDDRDLRWDLLLLRRNVELWTEVLAGSGPSGLERAMEIVATIREERGVRERELLASFDESEEMRMRFYLFALFHVTEAATELLLYRLHGAPNDALQRVYVALSLARSATSGDMQILPALEWLYEAAACVMQQRTPQLELLPEGERNGRVH
ncbi:MAG TPA: hypothetical protein VJO33_15560 [Gemmatimonadaceae bacterium]|nr:hypothetical protein [Gemmatimonadaceae bacterium]